VPYEQNSCIDCYGTDGTVVVKLFAQPDAALQKIIATKAYNGQPAAPLDIKNWSRVYVHLQDLAGTPEGTFLVGELTTGGGGIPNGSEQVSFGVQPGQDDTRPHPVSGQGITAALDLRGYSPDYVIERIMLAYEARTRFGA
jgi:hypothetical protein